MKKTLLLLLLTIVCGSSVIAQNPVIEDSVQLNKYNFTQFASESWSFIKQPVEWEGGDWLKLGIISAGTFLIMETADQPIRNAVLKDQIHSKSFPLEFGRMWGELYSPILLFSSFAIHSLLTDDTGTRKIAYEIAQASLYTGAVTYLLKVAIGRARPYMNEGSNSFHPFSSFITQDYHSLPGGHSVAAFALSTVLSRNAKPVWLKIIAYIPAALTFVSRVYQEKHWTSDDFLGAGLGYLIATWVVDQHENNKSILEISSAFPFSMRIAL
ncbi:MAG: phosphatase PAP2 family protein [Melioribacteraceae bacterium]|nr:phosphatase PAP2 family protein [Melioribacteraceae bacterium]